jgi:hypothetical protein
VLWNRWDIPIARPFSDICSQSKLQCQSSRQQTGFDSSRVLVIRIDPTLSWMRLSNTDQNCLRAGRNPTGEAWSSFSAIRTDSPFSKNYSPNCPPPQSTNPSSKNSGAAIVTPFSSFSTPSHPLSHHRHPWHPWHHPFHRDPHCLQIDLLRHSDQCLPDGRRPPCLQTDPSRLSAHYHQNAHYRQIDLSCHRDRCYPNGRRHHDVHLITTDLSNPSQCLPGPPQRQRQQGLHQMDRMEGGDSWMPT